GGGACRAAVAHCAGVWGSTGGSGEGRVHRVAGGTGVAILRMAARAFGSARRKRYGSPAAPRPFKPGGRLFRRQTTCRNRRDQSKCGESKAVGKAALSRFMVEACL